MTIAPAPAAPPTTRTMATRLRDWAARVPDQVAMREKNLGVWREITFGQYWDTAQDVGHGLLALGVERGDRVAAHSENRPEWNYIAVGVAAAGAATMGLYPTNPPPEVGYLLSDSGSRVLFAEDQEQVDKVLETTEPLPALEHIIYLEPRGIAGYDDPRLMSWDDFIKLGRQHRNTSPSGLSERTAEARPEDLATLIYTSGTTGPPKGAMLSVGNVDFAASAITGEHGILEPPPGSHDLILSYLPLCHVYERGFSVWFNLAAGTVINFAESIETVVRDLREVQPTIFQSVPRIYEKLHAGVLVGAASASRLKKLNFFVWMKAAERIGRTLERTEGKHTLGSRVLYGAGWVFMFRALKERLGMRRCRHAISAAAPIAPEILRFFMGIGVPVYEAYGMTENCALSTTNRPGRVKLGTVGEPYGGTELRLAEGTNEILIRHGGVFLGYWNRPDATAEAIDADGWMHTGDVGEWVDGTHIKIVDRMKDIIITAGGKNVSPSEIENSLKTSPFVKEAIVIGDRRPFLTALIGIEFDVVSGWAQSQGIPHTTYRDLSEKEEVRNLIAGVVAETNERFARVEQIKQFRLLPKELDHEEGDLTATQKVKRSVIERTFDDMIESMYRR